MEILVKYTKPSGLSGLCRDVSGLCRGVTNLCRGVTGLYRGVTSLRKNEEDVFLSWMTLGDGK